MSWWYRLTQGSVRSIAQPEWTSAVGEDYASSIMNWQVTDHFHAKQGRATGRLILDSATGLVKNSHHTSPLRKPLIVYLKRHWRFPWWVRLGATFWPNGNWSPASQEWRNLHWAREHDIPVPGALAMGECIGPRLGLSSYLVIRELTGMLPLHEAIPLAARVIGPRHFSTWKNLLIREIARIVHSLHEMRFFHKDLYLCHFFVPSPRAGDVRPGTVHLIDLHRLKQHRWTSWRWRHKDLAQLLYSTWSLAEISPKDRWRFFQEYRRQDKFTSRDRWLARLVFWKARHYARHNRQQTPSKAASLERAA